MDHADYAAAVAAVRERLLAYAAAAWASVTVDDEGLNWLLALFIPAVLAAQQTVAELTSVFFADVAGRDPAPVASSVTQGRGVEPETVYARPVITARAALSKGKSVEEAIDAGGRRLQNLAGTDLQMAKVRQSRESLRHAGVKFYRRVPTGTENCAMCLIASTQRYRVQNLMPIHPGCDCDIAVIPPGMDLDLVLDVDALNETHEQVQAFTGVEDRGGRAQDYRKLIVTREHGEVGPTLSWIGQKFTSQADIT